MNDRHDTLSYRAAGVDVSAGDALVEAIKPLARSTAREGCIGGLGGFGALFEVPRHFREPILVSATDGVGTKLKLAFREERHDTVGIDLVAMCANDVVVQGAEPLFFLDYFACGALSRRVAVEVISGITAGCKQAGAALIGGETAEMPGMYAPGEYDLAGFCVGVVERGGIITGEAIRPGDAIIGLASSGFHSNGFSLIRKVIDAHNVDIRASLDGETLAARILAPTRIYVKTLLALTREIAVHGMAHITGGGLTGNIKRVLPENTVARVHADRWSPPLVYDWLARTGRVSREEMHRTFNCGIGMTVMVSEADTDAALRVLRDNGERAACIGAIEAGSGAPDVVMA